MVATAVARLTSTKAALISTPPTVASLSEKAVIDINDRGNQLILTDYNDTITLAAQFIKVLDTDQPGDLAVRIIPLKHVSAQDLVKEITPLYQKISGKSANEPVEVSANDRSNSLIVFSSDANFKALEKIVATLDSEDALEKILRPFNSKTLMPKTSPNS